MVNAQKESLLCFGREQDLKGERGKSTYWCMPIVLSFFFPLFPLFFPLFSLLSFSFLSLVFFYSIFFLFCNTLCFFDPFSGHGKGPFIVPAVTSFLPLCPLTAFVWSGRTCRPPSLCDTHPYQTKAGLFHSSVHCSTLTYHGINAFSLFPSKHASNSSPLNLASFGWSVIPVGRTS